MVVFSDRDAYAGPAVAGYDIDPPLSRVAMISMHTSPLATLGSNDAGGMNLYVRHLAEHLAAQGLSVDIFTRRSDPWSPEVREIVPNVRVISLPAGPDAPVDKYALFNFVRDFASSIVTYCLRNSVDYEVIHAHYWLSGLVAELLRDEWSTPFIQMFHTTAHRKNLVARRENREPEPREQWERHLVRTADGLIAGNPEEYADFQALSRSAVDNVCLVPPGVDVARFRPSDKATARRQLGLDPTQTYALFVGRIDPIKGLDTLLDALSMLDRDGDALDLIIVGGDVDAAGAPVGSLTSVAEAAQRLGVGERVQFWGSVSNENLPDLYAAVDVVTIPSRYESFGLVAVEAMASSRPVIASRVGGLAYSIVDGESGLLIPPDDPEALAVALKRVLGDAELYARLAAGARPAAERFSWPSVATSLRQLYTRLAEGHRARLCCTELLA